MREKTLAVVALWSKERGRIARNMMAGRLEEIARSLRGDMHSGTFNEGTVGAGAVFIYEERVEEVDTP